MARYPTIGVLGGGQLARMLCEAASPLNIPVAVLDAASCPATRINDNPNNVAGSFKDPERIRELARRCDVLTVEIEHVNADVLEEVATVGVTVPGSTARKLVPVHPSWKTLRLIQNKFDQKVHFFSHGIPVAPQMALSSSSSSSSTTNNPAPGGLLDSLQLAAEQFGFPFMVKAMQESYDGRGNFKVTCQGDFALVAESLGRGGRGLYAEKWVPFEYELSVMVVRTEDDAGNLRNVHSYPVVETVHEDSICSLVYLPPRTAAEATRRAAQALAEETVSCLWGRGVFAVEMFVTPDQGLVVNEVAPRPHNSGHLTIEAVPHMSQFKAQLYAILDMVPRELRLQPKETCEALMVNILGGVASDSHDPLVRLAESIYNPDVDFYLHLYGKEARPNRKIGHITIKADTRNRPHSLTAASEDFIQAAAAIRQERLASAVAAAADALPSASPSASPSATPSATPSSLAPKPSSRNREAPLVMVTMGSDSDLGVLKAGLDKLEEFGVPYDCTITSAHRTPKRMVELANSAAARGIKVLIAAAGGAAHLPGMLASETTVPVIGVPVKASHLDGIDSLLSIVQMPRGIPVATVGINNSTNAALLAIRILGSHYPIYQDRMARYNKDMEVEVEGKAANLEDIGYAAYLTK